MDPSDRTDIIYHARPAIPYEHQGRNLPALFEGGRHYPVYPVEDDAWQWIRNHEHRAYKPADIQPCPCSDHIFKIAKKQFRVVPIADAWDYIAQLRDDEDMVTFTSAECDQIRASQRIHCSFVTNDHTHRPYNSRDASKLQPTSPMFVLAAYSPYVAGRTLQCTHDHNHPPGCNIYQLVRDYAHDADVRMVFANAVAPDTLVPGLHNHKGAIQAMACYIQQLDVVQDFISLGYPLKPLAVCEIVYTCSRKVQALLHFARMDRNCIWWLVPKDVIKIIHRMVFDGYHISKHNDRIHRWHTLPDADWAGIRPFDNNAPALDDGYESPLDLDLFG
jgi:hypothetical protein